MKSEEVKLLHALLLQLGNFIPDDELNASFYGKGTVQAVAAFQQKNGLKATGEVDAATAKSINAAIEQSQPNKDFEADGKDGGIRVFKGEALLAESPIKQNAQTNETIDLVVPPEDAKGKEDSSKAKEQLKVSGTVFSQQQKPVAGKQVVVVDVDLRGAAIASTAKTLQELKQSDGFEFLGTTQTDLKGRYEVGFTPESFQHSELQQADVIAYAVENETIAGRSKLIVWKDSEPAEIKDLDIQLTDSKQRGPSEYELLLGVLQPLLESSKLQPHELNEAQADFLAQETDQESKQISLIIDADKLLIDLASQSFKAGLFYGIGRQEIPLTWAAIAAKSEEQLRGALKRSVEQNIISDQPGDVVNDFINAIRQHSTKLLKESSLPEAKALNESLQIAFADPKTQVKFLEAARSFQHTDPEKFWQEQLPAAGFKTTEIESLQLTNQFYLLAGGYMPLVDQLKQKNVSPEKLVELTPEEWRDIVKKTGVPTQMPGKNDEEKQQLFLEGIQTQLNAAFPTAKIASMVRRNEFKMADGDVKTHLEAFLATNKQFDFSSSRVADFEGAIREIAKGKREDVKSSLLTLQRVYQVSPSPEVMTKLLDKNLTSAYQIAGIPQQTFIKNYGEILGGESVAWSVHQRAEHQVQRVQDVMVSVNELVNGVTPAATAQPAELTQLRQTLQRHIPNWEELFGGTNFCECRECRSVISPAAYFVDLMQFLKKSRITSGNVLDDVLLRRRPDLAHLKLTCENTNTIIPYIDLVNEILEYYLAHDGHLDENAAYNIENETQVELRANPQHTHTEAYRRLSNQVFPFQLPYHQPLDVIRTYLSQIGTSRYELMNHLGPEAGPTAGWSNALAAEYLNLSPKEFSILTGQNFDDSTNRDEDWKYFGYADEPEFRANRHRVSEVLDRSGISYVELIELVKTRFLNPPQETLNYLEEIFRSAVISPEQLYEKLQHIKNSSLDVNSDPQLRAALGRISPSVFTAWVNDHFEEFKQVVTLHEPDSACNLANTTLRSIRSIYEHLSSPEVPDPFFSRMHRFIRLWRKTGWNIQELDTMLAALQAPDISPAVISQIATAKKIQDKTRLSVAEIAVLWGVIDTHGPRSHYARLFLNKSVRRISTAFEPDERGRYLNNPAVKIGDQTIPLLAAFRINTVEFDSIIADLGMTATVEPLSLEAVSEIHRYVVLARALKIKLNDLLTLKRIFPINPFSRWSSGRFIDINPQATLDFVELACKVKDSGFKPDGLQYIFNLESPEARPQLKVEQTLQMVRQVREELLRIETDYPEPANGAAITEDILRPKLQLIFHPEVVEQFLGLINDNLLYGTGTERNLVIDIPEVLKAKANYKRATGRLEFKGVMTDAEKASLSALNANENYRVAVDRLYAQPEVFFVENFRIVFREETALNDALNSLLTRTATGLTATRKLTFFCRAYLPFLKTQLKNTAVLLRLSALLGLDLPQTVALVASRTDDLVRQFLARGLTGTYFNSTALSGPSEQRTDTSINFNWTSAPIRSITGTAYSVRWEAYVCPDQSAEYTYVVDVRERDDSFKLTIQDETLTKSEGDERRSWELARTLRAGEMYPVTLEYVHRSGSGGITLSWQADRLPRTPITPTNLYPAKETRSVHEAATKHHRAASFINRFALTAAEIAYFTLNAADFGNIDFTNLTPRVWSRVHDYTYLRKQTGLQGEAWLSFFIMAHGETLDQLNAWLKENLSWAPSDLSALQTHLRLTAASFVNEEKLILLLKVFELIRKTGLTAQKLIDWATTTDNFDTLENIAPSVQQTVKAKYDEDEWLEVAAHLSDKLRERQKQALIAALLVDRDLRRRDVRDADGLFEYFLIDVQMTACMDTSRIKQAISSVQLLVARCLLNLEDGVSPANIDAVKWSWIKNYRVWEAARKIFLFPENWLEPEWRDDRSPYFRELESDLQQSDITAFTVETAFRNYLFKLNEVAHLNVCGVYEDADTQTLHVFARTYQAPYQYFYRTRDRYKHWGAWEKVQLDIRGYEDLQTGGNQSGVHLLPIIWKSRVFLFWTELTEKTRPNPVAQDSAMGDMAKRKSTEIESLRYWEVRLAWSEYRDNKWTPKKLSNRFTETIDLSAPSFHFTTIEIRRGVEVLTVRASGGIFVLSDALADIQVQGPSHQESLDNFYMGIRRVSRPLRFVGDTYLLNHRDYKLIFSNSVPLTQFNLRPAHAFFYSDRERAYYVEPVIAQRSADTVKYANKIEFLPWSKFQGDVLTKDQVGLLSDRPSLSLNQVSPNFVANGSSSQLSATPLLLSAGIGAVSSLSGMPTTQTSPISNVGNAFGGELQNWVLNSPKVSVQLTNSGLRFNNFFHPYGNDYITKLNQQGVSGLLQVDTDPFYKRDASLFRDTYRPDTISGLVRTPLPSIEVDFDEFGAYSQYNYELFFHAPLYIATRLSRNGKYAEAMQWFHYIFDPTTNEAPDPAHPNARYWKVAPFRTQPSESLEQYLRKLQTGTDEEKRAITQKIEEWRDNPFKPHVIARGRPIAYMKNVVIKYIENLISWGDDLFRRDTIESINEATQIYIIAAHVLGKRPEFIPKRGETKAETYATIQSKLDAFSNALVQMENIFPFSSDFNVSAAGTGNPPSLLGVGRTLYFCIPNNEKLLSLWDTVADRLFKIRHCMNIGGVERKLALFEPPLDPGLLAQAAAAGLSIGNILSDLNTTAPIYRFSFLLQKAFEMVAEVKSLGNVLMSAIEKRDNEKLSRIRAGHERHLLELVTSIKERQRLEARANRESLEQNRETSKMRFDHYQGLLGENKDVPKAPEVPADLTADSALPAATIIGEVSLDVDVRLLEGGETGVKLIPKEKADIDLTEAAKWTQSSVSVVESIAGMLALIPQGQVRGTPLGVGAGFGFGGRQLSAFTSSFARLGQAVGTFLSMQASQASKMASFVRRDQEWVMQANMAAREIVQIDKQLIAAQIREQIAQKELDNHRRQIRNAEEVERFLHTKFSNEELYQWMKEQLVLVHKQAYQLAYDMAKQAEKAFRLESGRANTNFIQYGYWNDTYEGLTAGEKLHLALKQMERSQLEENRREYELTKHVSLALLDPEALLELKQNSKCEFTLPEELFDSDHPGHYFRRIKSVSLSIPCVAGPQTTISATLRLLRNSVRINSALGAGGYPRNQDEDDDRFVEYNVPFKAIATCSAQNDTGMFELNFRDERYLPFEAAGAISSWQLAMPDGLRQFDYNTITDVVIHLRYTARDGGSTLRTEVEEMMPSLKQRFLQNGYKRLFSLKHDFPQVFHQLTQPAPGSENRVVEFSITDQHLPYFLAHDDLSVSSLKVFLQAKEPNDRVARDGGYGIRINGVNLNIRAATTFGKNMITTSIAVNSAEDTWKLKRRHTIQVSSGRLPRNLEDLLLVFEI